MRLFRFLPLLLVAAWAAAADAKPDIAFLTAEQARAAIVDESVEPYFSLLLPREMTAKTGKPIDGDTLAAQRDACRKRYRDGVGEFSAAEQAGISRVVADVQPYLVAHYPAFAAEPWRFLKLGRDFEGGMPHTRGHCIVLSDDVMPMFVTGGKSAPGPDATMLLVHEQTHVVQRLHPELFAPLYTEAWGFVRLAQAPALAAELTEHQLVNPDGIACVWAFPIPGKDGASELILPQVLIGGAEVPRMPQDFAVVGLTLEKKGDGWAYALGVGDHLSGKPLEDIDAYNEAFAPSEENFHPNEICAELFSRQVTLGFLGREEDETPCQKALRAWAESWLGTTDAKATRAPLTRMERPAPAPTWKPGVAGAGEIVYTFKEGDTLSSVARRFNVDLSWIIKRNDIEDEAIVKPGLQVVVPRPAKP